MFVDVADAASTDIASATAALLSESDARAEGDQTAALHSALDVLLLDEQPEASLEQLAASAPSRVCTKTFSMGDGACARSASSARARGPFAIR